MHTPTLWNRLIQLNMSYEERYVRVLLGATLIMFAVFVPFAWAWAGLYPLATGLSGTSPIYRLLGIQRHDSPASR